MNRAELEARALAGIPDTLLAGQGINKVLTEAVARRRETVLYGAVTGKEMGPGPFVYCNGQVSRPGGDTYEVIAIPTPIAAATPQMWADRDARGKRIAAALNAVEGIPTLALESGALGEVLRLASAGEDVSPALAVLFGLGRPQRPPK